MMAAEHDTGRRARNKQRIRQEITDAAFQLFVDRGFNDTTVDDIVTVAGVSRRTFYRYFSSTQDVFHAWDTAIAERLHQAVIGRPSSEPPLLAAANALLTVFATYEIEQSRSIALMRLMNDSPWVQPQRARAAAIWGDGIMRGIKFRFQPSEPPLIAEIAASLVVAVAREATDHWIAQGAEGDFTRLLSEAFDIADLLYAENLAAAPSSVLRKRKRDIGH